MQTTLKVLETGNLNSAVHKDPMTVPVPEVETKLMQNYVDASPFITNKPGSLHVVRNAQGEAEIFHTDAQGSLYNIYPDTGSDTGWSRCLVGISMPDSQVYAVGLTEEGKLIVFFVSSNRAINFVESSHDAPRQWGKAQSIGQPFLYGIRSIKTLNYGNRLYVSSEVFTSDASKPKVDLDIYASVWDSTHPGLGQRIYQAADVLQNDQSLLAQPYGSLVNGTPQVALSLFVKSIVNWTYSSLPITGDAPRVLAVPLPIQSTQVITQDIVAVNDPQGSFKGFIIQIHVGGNDAIYWLKSPQMASPSDIQSILVGTSKYTIVSCNASCTKEGDLEIFAQTINAADNLNLFLTYLREDAKSSTGWTSPIPLLKIGTRQMASTIRCTYNRDGYSETFFTTNTPNQTATISVLWQDPASTDWHSTLIEEDLADIQGFASYTTQITLLDTLGAVCPNQAVELWAEDLLLLTVNGRTTWVDDQQHISCTTNAFGQINVMAPTGSLNTPKLLFRTPFMNSDQDAYVIQPNATIEARLRNVASQDIANLRDAQGKQLVPNGTNQQNLANAFKTLFAQAPVSPALELSAGMSYPGAPHLLHPRHQQNYRRGPAAKTASPCWHMSFAHHNIHFATLSDREAQTLKETWLKTLPHLTDSPGNTWDWGSLLDAIDQGIATLIEVLQQPAAVTFTLIIEGVQYVFSTLIQWTTELVLDMVDALCETMGILVSRLLEALGELFNWNDILLTHDAIIHSIRQTLLFLQMAAPRIQSRFDQGLQGLQGKVDQAFEQVLKQFAATTTIADYVQASTPPTEDGARAKTALSNNIVLNQIVSNAASGQASLTRQVGSAAGTTDAANQFLTFIEQKIPLDADGNPVSGSPMDKLFQLAQSAATSADTFLQVVMQELLSLVNQLVDAIFSGIQTVVDSLFGAFNTLISAFLTLLEDDSLVAIPFLSGLYESITGKPLTMLDLMAWIIAIPATELYKSVYGSAPFTNDADPQSGLQSFQEAYTAQNLLQASGLGSALQRRQAQDFFKAPSQRASTAFKWMGTFCYTYKALCGAAIDTWGLLPQLNAAPTILPFLVVATECAGTILTTPWLIGLPMTWNDCTNVQALANTLWYLRVAGALIDVAFFQYFGKPLKTVNDYGAIGYSVYSALYWSLTVWQASMMDMDNPKNQLQASASIMGAFPGVISFLRCKKLNSGTRDIPLLVLVVLEILLGTATTGVNIALLEKYP